MTSMRASESCLRQPLKASRETLRRSSGTCAPGEQGSSALPAASAYVKCKSSALGVYGSDSCRLLWIKIADGEKRAGLVELMKLCLRDKKVCLAARCLGRLVDGQPRACKRMQWSVQADYGGSTQCAAGSTTLSVVLLCAQLDKRVAMEVLENDCMQQIGLVESNDHWRKKEIRYNTKTLYTVSK